MCVAILHTGAGARQETGRGTGRAPGAGRPRCGRACEGGRGAGMGVQVWAARPACWASRCRHGRTRHTSECAGREEGLVQAGYKSKQGTCRADRGMCAEERGWEARGGTRRTDQRGGEGAFMCCRGGREGTRPCGAGVGVMHRTSKACAAQGQKRAACWRGAAHSRCATAAALSAWGIWRQRRHSRAPARGRRRRSRRCKER